MNLARAITLICSLHAAATNSQSRVTLFTSFFFFFYPLHFLTSSGNSPNQADRLSVLQPQRLQETRLASALSTEKQPPHSSKNPEQKQKTSGGWLLDSSAPASSLTAFQKGFSSKGFYLIQTTFTGLPSAKAKLQRTRPAYPRASRRRRDQRVAGGAPPGPAVLARARSQF